MRILGHGVAAVGATQRDVKVPLRSKVGVTPGRGRLQFDTRIFAVNAKSFSRFFEVCRRRRA